MDRCALICTTRHLGDVTLWHVACPDLPFAVPGTGWHDSREAAETSFCEVYALAADRYRSLRDPRWKDPEWVEECEGRRRMEDTGLEFLFRTGRLGRRPYNALVNAGFETLGDVALLPHGKLQMVRGIGRKGMEEVMALLRRYDID